MKLALTPEQEAYRQTVRSFVETYVAPHAATIDQSNVFPSDVVLEAGRHGLLGITVPTDHGGAGLDHLSYALAIEEVSAGSATVGVILAVNNSLVAEVLVEFGTPEQQARWLQSLSSGDALGAFALSETDAGTDAANQQTVARADGDGFRVSGRKVWVANAAVADVLLVFAATTTGAGGRGISAFLIPADASGLSTTATIDTLGVRGLGATDLVLDDVRLGPDALLGDLDAGFPLAMWALDGGRVAIAAQALGIGRSAFDQALHHAIRRETFGRPIAEYQAVQWMLADIATDLDAARMLVYKAAVARDQKERCTLEVAMAKLSASEAAHRAADKALQILASAGYRQGSTVERLFRDVRATEIYQGTSEVQRMIIASQVVGE